METKVISSGLQFFSLPQNYVPPESEKFSEVSFCEDVPVIALEDEQIGNILSKILDIPASSGVFWVPNHIVEEKLRNELHEVSREYFTQSMEEKMKLYSENPAKTTRLSKRSYVKEKAHYLFDGLRLTSSKSEEASEWPSKPTAFKDTASKYCAKVREVGFKLQEAIAESLGMDKNYIKNALGEQGHHMGINYYPPCPQPELTYGLSGHTDHNALTIHLLDSEGAGFQVFEDGKWLSIKPEPNMFLVTIGDQLQELSKGKYKSTRYRILPGADKPRISISSFFCPSDDAINNTLKPLTTEASQANKTYHSFW